MTRLYFAVYYAENLKKVRHTGRTAFISLLKGANYIEWSEGDAGA